MFWKIFGVLVFLGLMSSTMTAQDETFYDEPPDDSVLSISPDGTMMSTFSTSSYKGGVLDQPYYAALRDDSGRIIQRFEAERHLFWFPDGMVTLFVEWTEVWTRKLLILDSATGEKRLIADVKLVYFLWSPDGRWLLIISESDVLLWERATDTLVTLLVDPYDKAKVEWSPDSRHIAVMRLIDTSGYVFVYDVAQKQFSDSLFQSPVIVDPDNSLSSTWISTLWSPDSQHIAVAVDDDVYDVELTTLSVKHVGGLDLPEEKIVMISWSADATEIYYKHYWVSRQPPGLYQMALEDGAISLVLPGYGELDHGEVVFAPDRRHFLFHDWRSLVVGIGDTETWVVTPFENITAHLVQSVFWTSDGQFVLMSLCTDDQNDFDIYRFDMQTRALVMLTEDGVSGKPETCVRIG